MTSKEALDLAKRIARMTDGDVAHFIRESVRQKQLSTAVRALNGLMTEPDAQSRTAATRAFQTLGLPT